MKQYVVDAFTDSIFKGNPAAICVPDAWPTDELMLLMAAENNLSETAFAVKEGDGYRLRWFTPTVEMDLCGHATLACAFVVLNFVDKGREAVTFHTLSGELTVCRRDGLYEMDFPAYTLKTVPVTDAMADATGAMPIEAYMGRDLLLVYDDEDMIRHMSPDMNKVEALEGYLLNVTAKGKDYDCVSRTFSPKCGVPEDPVCGSAHCHIVPYWANKLNKATIRAYQASKRGGALHCQWKGDRVSLAGNAMLYSIADIFV